MKRITTATKWTASTKSTEQPNTSLTITATLPESTDAARRPISGSELERTGCDALFKTASGSGVRNLTAKELQLLELLSFGYENGDIAEHFQTSRQAVKNMLRTINLKLGADNRTHAVAISFRNGLLPLRTPR